MHEKIAEDCVGAEFTLKMKYLSKFFKSSIEERLILDIFHSKEKVLDGLNAKYKKSLRQHTKDLIDYAREHKFEIDLERTRSVCFWRLLL